MSNPLQQTIEALAKEKGIEPDLIITAIEDAVLTASRKYYKSEENLKTKFNSDTGQIELFAVMQIVDEVTDPSTEISLTEAQKLYGDEAEVDMEIEFPKPTDVLGRIAAQTAKHVIFQKVREAERENIYAEYSERLGEVMSGTVKRFENGDIIFEAGRVEALLPRREQSRAENYTTGDRRVRLTIDSGLRLYDQTRSAIPNLDRPSPAEPVAVVELKCAAEDSVELRSVASRLPLQRVAYSKYAQGVLTSLERMEPAAGPLGRRSTVETPTVQTLQQRRAA